VIATSNPRLLPASFSSGPLTRFRIEPSYIPGP
jgi:hypothetical protein